MVLASGNVPTANLPDVFSDLLTATVSSSRNFHRLEHLGRRGLRTFHEETVTGLLIAELTGRPFDVVAPCPACASESCREWNGQAPPVPMSARARTLTRYEEGGNKKTGVPGTGADFVIELREVDVNGGQDNGGLAKTRLLVQAKRVRPGVRINLPKLQYADLLKAATDLDAAPFYALYVQQPDAHASTPTGCAVHTTAAERSIVLVPAGSPGTAGYLPGKTVVGMLELGLPLRCLAGCPTTGTNYATPVATSVKKFVQKAFAEYEPATEHSQALDGAERLVIDAGHRFVAPPQTKLANEVLAVRLGPQQDAPEADRRYIGYAPSMSLDEVREAARKWWRMNEPRAATVRYVIALTWSGHVVEVYRALPGIESVVEGAGTRVAYRLIEEADDDLRQRLMAMAQSLSELPPAARNPIRYLGPLSSTQ